MGPQAFLLQQQECLPFTRYSTWHVTLYLLAGTTRIAMTNSSDKQEFVHWMEISESLGVDVSHEIESYFNGAAELGGSPPVSDDIKTLVSSTARQLAQKSSERSAGASIVARVESAPSSAIASESGERQSIKSSPSTKAAQPTVTKENNDKQPNESKENSVNELGLDWAAPAPKTSEPHTAADKSESTRQRKRETPAEIKPREAATKPEPAKLETIQPPIELSGWDSLASELGVASRKPAVSPARPSAIQKPVETPNVLPPVVPSNEKSSFGAGLVDVPASTRQPMREAKIDRPKTDRPKTDRPKTDRPKTDRPKTERPRHVEPLGFFDSPADPSDQSELRLEDSEIELIDDDSPESIDDGIVESAWDEDFVEFEIEDLDPKAGRERGSRNRESRSSRPTKIEKPIRDKEIDLDKDFVDLEMETPAPESRTADLETESDQKSGARSSRRRKPRGRRRSGEQPSAEKSKDPLSLEDARSAKKPASKPAPVGDQGDDFDDDDDDFERDESGGDARTSKPRNLPTWNETVDVIVQSNIASRKKQPPRRRRGGSGGQGGPNRH